MLGETKVNSPSPVHYHDARRAKAPPIGYWFISCIVMLLRLLLCLVGLLLNVKRPPAIIYSALLACTVLSLWGQADAPVTRLLDTTIASPEVLTGEALAKQTGWRPIVEDNLSHEFAGDTVFLNDKLAVVLRKQGTGPELYGKASARFQFRAALASPIEGLKVLENTSSAVKLELGFKAGGPAPVRLRLTAGEAILEVQSSTSTGHLEVRSKTRHVVVPDYFGNDLVYSPRQDRALCLPTENFCLCLLEGNDSMLMAVWQSNQQEVRLTGGGSGPPSLEILCAKDKSLWLALLEHPGIWHEKGGSAADDWSPPFPAKWRCSLRRADGAAASSYLDARGRGEPTAGAQETPVIVYPIDRSTTTPLTATCPTDVMRNTLGVGPCQYILACEGLGAQGDPTPNSVMGWVEKQFEQRKQRKAAEDIAEGLQVMNRHIGDARLRIEGYARSSRQGRQFLAGKPHEFIEILNDLDRAAAAGLTAAAAPERARDLSGQVQALIAREDGLEQCRQLGQQLRSIGAAQDRSLAECRMNVRRLRAHALTIEPPDLAVQKIADQILQRK